MSYEMTHDELLAKIAKIVIATFILVGLNIQPAQAWETEDVYGIRPAGGWTVSNIPFYQVARKYLIANNRIYIAKQKRKLNDTR